MKTSYFLHIQLVVVVIFLLASISCKTKQNNTTPINDTYKIADENTLLKKIDSTAHTYANLNIKFAVRIKIGKEENSLRGKLKIRRDSCVWVSALPLGIEAARIIATKNETGMINFFKRNYFTGSYDMLSSQIGYPINYDMLEAILTGTPLFIADKATYRLSDDKKNGYYFSPFDKNDFEKIIENKQIPIEPTVQALWFTSDAKLLKNVLYDAPQKRHLEINYTNYSLIGTNILPSNISVQIRTPKETAHFTIEYTKIEADQPDMEYPFTIPDSYEKMELK